MALLTTAALLTVLWTFLNPIYFENDDAAIHLTISGKDLPGEPPISFLVFTHEALARMAVRIQSALPFLPVWDLILALALAAGTASLGALAWDAIRATSWERGAAVITILTAAVPFLTGLQFTISAVICGGAAVVIVMSELFRTAPPRRSMLIAPILLLLVGYSIRPMAVEGAALVILVCFVPVATARPPRRSRLARLGAVGAVLVVSFTALDAVDRALYPERGRWAAYYTYTWQFVSLIDWNSSARDAQLNAIRQAAGWSPNDWQMLWLGWAGTDASVFGPAPVARAQQALIVASSPLEQVRAFIANFDMRATRELLGQLSFVAALTLALAAGLGSLRALFLTATVLALFAVICVVVQAGFKELPFRLLAPLSACLVGVVIVGIAEHLRPRGPRVKAVAMALTMGLLAQQSWAAAKQARAENAHAQSIEPQVMEVLELNPSLLVLHGDAFPAAHWWRPFRQPPARFPMIRLGGNNGHPRLQHYLRTTGRPRLLVSICGDPSIWVVAERSRIDFVTQYMAEHVGRGVTWEPVFEGSFRVWRCR